MCFDIVREIHIKIAYITVYNGALKQRKNLLSVPYWQKKHWSNWRMLQSDLPPLVLYQTVPYGTGTSTDSIQMIGTSTVPVLVTVW